MCSSLHSNRSFKSAFIGLSLFVFGSSPAYSDSLELGQAKYVLQNLQIEAMYANQELQTARQQHLLTKNDVADAKQRVAEQIKSSAEYRTVRDRLEELQSKLATAREQATADLRQDSTYQVALKTLEEAKLRQHEAQGSTGSAEARQAAAKVVLSARMNLRSLEDQALLRFPGAKDWTEECKTAQQELLQWNQRVQSETEHDANVTSAQRESGANYVRFQNAQRNMKRLKSTIAQQQNYVVQLSIRERRQESDDKKSKRDKDDGESRRERAAAVFRATGWRFIPAGSNP